MEARLLLMTAWLVHTDADADGASVQTNPPEGATEPLKQRYESVLALHQIVQDMCHAEGDMADTTWQERFGQAADKLAQHPVFKNATDPDHDIADDLFAGFWDTDKATFIAKTESAWRRATMSLCNCCFASVSLSVAAAKYEAAGHPWPVKNLSSVATYAALHERSFHMHASTEHGLKSLAAKFKTDIEDAKEFLSRIKSTVMNASKALAAHRSEAVKKEKQKDKDRQKEEKKVLQAQKDALRQVRMLCKDKTSPGLLSYCGGWVSPIQVFDDISEFKAAAAKDDFDTTSPYLVKECKSLQALLELPLIKMAFTNFRAQLPIAEAIKHKRKAQCPFQLPVAGQVRSAMLELTPGSRIPFMSDAPVSQWGCMTDMLQAGFEHMTLGSLRFTAKGSREIAMAPFDQVMKVAEQIAETRSKAITLDDAHTLHELVENTMLHDMNEAGIAIAEKVGVTAFRGTSSAGSLMFVPAGFVCVERALGSEAAYGWRTSVIESKGVVDHALASLEKKLLTYTSEEKNPTLRAIATVRQSIAKHLKG